MKPSKRELVWLPAMLELNADIPRRLHMGRFPVEVRYRGQVPQCFRCGEQGHRAIYCENEVKCLKCGLTGHMRTEQCFRCGNVGHVKENCPDILQLDVPSLSKKRQ